MTTSTPDAISAALGDAVVDPLEAHYQLNSQPPRIAVRPSSPADVEATLALASEHNLAVAPIGGATLTGLGMPIERYDVAIDLTGLDGVVDYEPDDFTITIGAGMALADLQRTLAANGQFVPLDHGRFEQATVGGVIAVGRGGLRRTAFGYPRDWLIGMHMVRADGTPIKGGGRVVKNVSGYDLPKLFCGSLGTLGVIVELTFKLRPLPTSDQIVVLAAEDFPAALVAARAAGQAEPLLQAAVAVSAASVNALASVELDVAPGAAAVVLRMSGLEQSVLETLDSAARAARNAGATGGRPSPDGVIEIWQAILDLELATADDQLRLRLGVRPASLGDAQRELARHVPGAERWIGAADSGLLFVDAPCDDVADAARNLQAARAALEPLGANLTIDQAPLNLKRLIDIWGSAGPGARLMHRVKDEFDPQHILNPGRYVDGI